MALAFFYLNSLLSLGCVTFAFLFSMESISHFNTWQSVFFLFLLFLAFMIICFLVYILFSFFLAPFAYLAFIENIGVSIKEKNKDKILFAIMLIMAVLSPILSTVLLIINTKPLIDLVETLTK